RGRRTGSSRLVMARILRVKQGFFVTSGHSRGPDAEYPRGLRATDQATVARRPSTRLLSMPPAIQSAMANSPYYCLRSLVRGGRGAGGRVSCSSGAGDEVGKDPAFAISGRDSVGTDAATGTVRAGSLRSREAASICGASAADPRKAGRGGRLASSPVRCMALG